MLIFIFFLSACGGGDGDGDGDSTRLPSTENGVVITSTGGSFTFENGIVLYVPSDAVIEPVTVQLTTLDQTKTQHILDGAGIYSKQFLGGFSAKPDGFTFLKPVKVQFPIKQDFSGRNLPIHMKQNQWTGAYYPSKTSLNLKPAEGIVELTISSFSNNAVTETEGAVAQLCEAQDPCRCLEFEVKEESRSGIYSDQNCQVAEMRGSITYKQCNPIVTESWVFIEHSDGCVPVLDLNAESNPIIQGSTSEIEAKVVYAGENYPAAELSFSINGPASLSAQSGITDINGIAHTTLIGSGIDEGIAEVTAYGNILYKPEEITINGEVLELTERYHYVQKHTQVTIGNGPTMRLLIGNGLNDGVFHFGQDTTARVILVQFDPITYEPVIHSNIPVTLELSGPGELASSSLTTSPDISGIGADADTIVTAGNSEGTVSVKASAQVTTLVSGSEVTFNLEAHDEIYVRDLSEYITGSFTINTTEALGEISGVPSYYDVSLNGSFYFYTFSDRCNEELAWLNTLYQTDLFSDFDLCGQGEVTLEGAFRGPLNCSASPVHYNDTRGICFYGDHPGLENDFFLNQAECDTYIYDMVEINCEECDAYGYCWTDSFYHHIRNGMWMLGLVGNDAVNQVGWYFPGDVLTSSTSYFSPLYFSEFTGDWSMTIQRP